jgi:hypothetical protein
MSDSTVSVANGAVLSTADAAATAHAGERASTESVERLQVVAKTRAAEAEASRQVRNSKS